METVKRVTDHPTLNTVILSMASALMFSCSISGFVAHSKLAATTATHRTRGFLMGASIFSLIAVALLIVGIFLVRYHSNKMEPAFTSWFSIGILITSVVLMLISGITYAVVASRLSKTTYTTAHRFATVSSVLTFGAIAILAVSFITALFAMGKKQQTFPRPTLDLKPSYLQKDGAMKQLHQLQTGEGVQGIVQERTQQ